MEIKITNDITNALIGRREIEFLITGEDQTPRRDVVKTELCKKLSLSPDSTIVIKIDQTYGLRQCKGMAHSYENEAQLKKHEQEHILDRIAKRAKKDAAKASGAAPEPEPKKEEKKEEKKE